jgi:hypothetical protein
MKVHAFRAIPVALLLAATALTAVAEEYQCRTAGGCTATMGGGDNPRTVRFRRGDLVSTDDGWIVNPGDGWVKIYRRTDFGGWR